MNWQWVLVTVMFGLHIGGEEKRWIRRYCEERGSYSICIRNFSLLEALLFGELLVVGSSWSRIAYISSFFLFFCLFVLVLM